MAELTIEFDRAYFLQSTKNLQRHVHIPEEGCSPPNTICHIVNRDFGFVTMPVPIGEEGVGVQIPERILV